MNIRSGNNLATFNDDGWLMSLNISGQEWDFYNDRPGWSIKLAGDESAYYCDKAPVEIKESDDQLILRYDSLKNIDKNQCSANVQVKWFWDGELLCCGVKVESLQKEATLDAIVFPDVVLESNEKTILTLPRDAGGQVENLSEVLRDDPELDGEILFKNMHMQIVGWEDGDRGLRFESHDADGWIRFMRLNAQPDRRIRFSLEHFVPRVSDIENFELPYSTGLGVFENGWYGCAQEYGKWALKQKWASRGKQERQDSYIGELSCWLWNRGNSKDVCPPANELAKRIGQPVALDWYWWHKHPYDMGYPDYFPPREGTETFINAMKDVQDNGNFVQVYTNGMSWDMELDSWQSQAKDCNIVLEDGEFFNVAYNTWTNHRLGHMCGASADWKNKVQEIAENINGLGLDGLYLDQIATLGSIKRCFSSDHGHLPGGGDYAVKGFRSILENVREKFPNLVLSSESTAEFFWDLLDGNITLYSSFERIFSPMNSFLAKMNPIPFASAVYHGRGVMFGNYTIVDSIPPYDELWPVEGKPDAEKERDWMKIAPEQFAFELARTVSFGMQPMVANLKMKHLTEDVYADDIAFLVELSKVYHANRDWLLWGKLMEPCELVCDERDVAFVRRGIFTDPDDVDVITKTWPALFSSTWKDDNGCVKTFLINYTKENQKAVYPVPAKYKVVNGGEFLTENTEQGLAGVIPPASINIIEQELL